MSMDDKSYQIIQELCEQGDELVDEEQYDAAIEKYNKALSLIPEPKYYYEAATWVYTAIGDALFWQNSYKQALKMFQEALKCPDGIGNPFILLRIGECFFETGSFDNAKNYLLQAYMVEGEEIFENDDDKYFEFIKDLI